MQDLPNDYTGTEPRTTAGERWESGEPRPSAAEASSRTRRLRDGASQTLRSAGQKVSAAYDRTSDQATRAYHGARGYARNNPGIAAATVFAAGVGVGVLLGVRSTARAYRRGFVPTVAFALAQAVRDVFDRLA